MNTATPTTARSVHPGRTTTSTSWRSPRRSHRSQGRHQHGTKGMMPASTPATPTTARCVHPGRTTTSTSWRSPRRSHRSRGRHYHGTKGTMPAQHTSHADNGPQRASWTNYHVHELAITTPEPSIPGTAPTRHQRHDASSAHRPRRQRPAACILDELRPRAGLPQRDRPLVYSNNHCQICHRF